MTIREVIQQTLAGDATLSGLLSGGVHMATEISRQLTPAAFDANGELQPCALVKLGSDTATGPYTTSSRTTCTVYFYQRTGYGVIDAALIRAYTLLNQAKLESGVWICQHADDVLDQIDTALDASMALSRYSITRLR